jgi:hypothetical protein
MTPDELIGSAGIRIATVVFSLLCVAGFVVSHYGVFAKTRGPVLTLAVVCGILAGVGAIHCFQGVFSLWMRLARILNTVVTTLLFGACYILVVPFFFLVIRLLDPLCLRKRPEPPTFWLERPHATVDITSLERMG